MPTVKEKSSANTRVAQLRNDHDKYPAPAVHPNKLKTPESRKREAQSSSSPLAICGYPSKK